MPPKRKLTYTPPPTPTDFKRAKADTTAAKSKISGGAGGLGAPTVAAKRGDGVMRVMYMSMGLGDCAILATPGGKTVMVDCGSTDVDKGAWDTPAAAMAATMASAQKAVYDDLFLGTTDTLDILILTHPDSDHYNRLSTVLKPGTKIDKVYHSDALSAYNSVGTEAWITTAAGAANIKQVIHNNDPTNKAPGSVRLGGVDVVAGVGVGYTDALDANGGIVILNEPQCKITIFAAGVAYNYATDNSNETNRGSVVTLVEGNGKKLLFCGDGTINTERYLLNKGTVAARLADVDLTTIGHHASLQTSSLEAYVNALRPKSALASAGQNIKKHHLPSWGVLRRYVASMNGRVPKPTATPHLVRAFQKTQTREETMTLPIYTTGSSGIIVREYEAP